MSDDMPLCLIVNCNQIPTKEDFVDSNKFKIYVCDKHYAEKNGENTRSSDQVGVDDIVEMAIRLGRYIEREKLGLNQPRLLTDNQDPTKPIATREKLEALIASKVEEAKREWLDEQILHLLTDIYPEDVFTPPTKEDFDRINDFDANLHTRLHCDGIRHGLQVLRREVRGLSARDDLKALQSKKGG